ncbi:MAG: secondary thiamine-phosphate synthase enzyme YjbQ [Gammaproteobacteria bacterium]
MTHQEILAIQTKDRSILDITAAVVRVVERASYPMGLCNLFIRHTSASLIVCENADVQVRRDLEAFMSRLVPDGDPLFRHTAEGKDDMPAHVRTILTQTSLVIPIQDYHLALGTWQGIYLWEHRRMAYCREVVVTVLN